MHLQGHAYVCTCSCVRARGLVSRLGLKGLRAIVLSFDPAAVRYAVQVDTTNERVRVREANLRACG